MNHETIYRVEENQRARKAPTTFSQIRLRFRYRHRNRVCGRAAAPTNAETTLSDEYQFAHDGASEIGQTYSARNRSPTHTCERPSRQRPAHFAVRYQDAE